VWCTMVVFPQKWSSFFPYAFMCIRMHASAFICNSLFFLCIQTYCNRLHSNAFYNHFELLHSSDARRLHSDAFSYLLHSGQVAF